MTKDKNNQIFDFLTRHDTSRRKLSAERTLPTLTFPLGGASGCSFLDLRSSRIESGTIPGNLIGFKLNKGETLARSALTSHLGEFCLQLSLFDEADEDRCGDRSALWGEAVS